MWTALIWLSIGTGGMLSWRRRWTFRFHKLRANSWLAEELLAFQEFLCCMELFKVQNTEPDALLATRSTALCSAADAGLWNCRQVLGQIRNPTWHLRPQMKRHIRSLSFAFTVNVRKENGVTYCLYLLYFQDFLDDITRSKWYVRVF